MKKILLFLLSGLCLMMASSGYAQTMTNTDNTITLTNTCLNPGFAGGTYTLQLAYNSPADGFHPAQSFPGCTVTSNGATMTITAPGASFPTLLNTGWFSLPDADNGSISLTGGPTSGIIFWYHEPDGSIKFNCIALPIYFSNFHGIASNGSVQLTWDTQTEQNSTVIEIYRSGTDGNFYKIGQVAAAGNSNSILHYSFTDNNPAADNYYKLKMLNSQGTQAITSIIIRVTCQGCVYTPPAPVYCPYTINGPDQICNIEQITAYSLSSAVPNYSTLVWSVDNPSAVRLATYPSYDRTQVTLQKKNSSAGVTLTATLSGCSNAITKYIIVGTPPPTIYANIGCPYLYASVISAPGATSYAWFLTDETQGTTTWNSVSAYAWDPYIGTGDTYDIGMTYTNVCGTSEQSVLYGYICPTDGGGPGHDPWGDLPYLPDIQMAPNPSSGIVSIGLAPAANGVTGLTGAAAKGAGKVAVSSTAKSRAKEVKAPAGQQKIYRVKVLDVQGVVRAAFSYPGGIERTSLDLSQLTNGIYIVQVFDNKRWTSGKVVIAK